MGGKLAYLAATRTDVSCSVGYYGMGIEALLDEAKQIKGPAGAAFRRTGRLLPAAGPRRDPALPAQPAQDRVVPLPRRRSRLRPRRRHALRQTGLPDGPRTQHRRPEAEIGPNFDLSALWDEHVRHEFDTRDVAATMATMVAEPYVNHVPTLTGGVGQRELSRFYRHHFIHGNPPDMTLTPISRTVGALQVVDEFVMRFTHSCEIDWLLPGVPPTGRFVEIPMLGVVRFRGDRLYHEHICGTRPACWCRSACSTRRACRSRGGKRAQAARRKPAVEPPDGALGSQRRTRPLAAG